MFKSVTLQRAQGVNNSAQIFKRIQFGLDYWNRGEYDELVKDTYNLIMGYMGKYCWNQTEEQCHQTFSNLVLKGRLREALQFLCDREKGGVFQPEKLAYDSTITITKIIT